MDSGIYEIRILLKPVLEEDEKDVDAKLLQEFKNFSVVVKKGDTQATIQTHIFMKTSLLPSTQNLALHIEKDNKFSPLELYGFDGEHFDKLKSLSKGKLFLEVTSKLQIERDDEDTIAFLDDLQGIEKILSERQGRPRPESEDASMSESDDPDTIMFGPQVVSSQNSPGNESKVTFNEFMKTSFGKM